MDFITVAHELGITLPTPAYLIGVLLFSLIGIVAYYRGKTKQRPRVRWLGLVLMLYPYVVWSTALIYVVGLGLCVATWFADRQG